MLGADGNEVVNNNSGATDRIVLNLSKNKKSRNLTCVPNIGAIKKLKFLIPNAKMAFNNLWLAFIKASIFQYFDLEHHIWIETDISKYAIDKVLS